MPVEYDDGNTQQDLDIIMIYYTSLYSSAFFTQLSFQISKQGLWNDPFSNN